ncbi:MAG: VIT1/CCC1 transporter family protein [Candidatus Eremiobacteraeota bacterium]|jgi:VIT1/CCC1 family predicted Fe2+/Mn2+ transporter|nr:VIT1/CCC1 transporter family protein [Candidatus Eremiobacteraeota bacterium]
MTNGTDSSFFNPLNELWHGMEKKLIREVIFGLNDGLVTAFGFIAGVNGAHVKPLVVILTGVAEAVAGGLSMFFGAYLSTKAQREFFESEIKREKMEIETMPEQEEDEVRQIYLKKGFTPEETEMIVKRITSNKEEWLAFMMKEELGLFPENFDNPIKSAGVIGISFFTAALIPVIPYSILSVRSAAFLISSLITLFTLFFVGAGKTKITKTSWMKGGFEMLMIGMIAGLVGFGVGKLMILLKLGGVGV